MVDRVCDYDLLDDVWLLNNFFLVFYVKMSIWFY